MAGFKDSGFMKFLRYTVEQGKEKVAGITDRLKQPGVDGEESVMDTFTTAFKKPASQTVDAPVESEKVEEATVEKAKPVTEKITKTETKKEEEIKQAPKEKVSAKKTTKSTAKKTSPAKAKDTVSAKEVKSTDKTPAKTKKATPKKASSGGKREEKIKKYIEDIKKHNGSVDEAFVEVIVKNLGPSIYKKDAETVSCSDPKELDYLRNNFLIKKLGFEKSDKEMLDGEIQKVCETMKGTRNKYRATFYYILAKNLNKESALS